MKTITKTINLYTFDELSPEAQKKAHEEYVNNNEYPFLEDDLIYHLNEELPKYNIIADTNVSILCSLSHCQGDGAMFEGSITWEKKYRVKIKHSGRYYHYNSKEFEIFDLDIGEPIYNSKLDKKFNDIYVKICKDLEQYGYDVIETDNSIENFKDLCHANDYYFTKDGELTLN